MQQKEENKFSNNLVIFILEARGAFAMKIQNDIIQKRVFWEPQFYLKLSNLI